MVGCGLFRPGICSCFQMQVELGEYLSHSKNPRKIAGANKPPSPKGPTFLLPEDKYSFAIYLYASKDK
jgi:hypothetical protein